VSGLLAGMGRVKPNLIGPPGTERWLATLVPKTRPVPYRPRLNSPNRRMRTRMYGGVEGASGRPLPLSRLLFVCRSQARRLPACRQTIQKVADRLLESLHHLFHNVANRRDGCIMALVAPITTSASSCYAPLRNRGRGLEKVGVKFKPGCAAV
jgi:hypothetical protein